MRYLRVYCIFISIQFEASLYNRWKFKYINTPDLSWAECIDNLHTYMPPTASIWHHTCFVEVWILADCSSSRSQYGQHRHPGTPHVHGAGSAPSCLPSPVSQTREGAHLWLPARSHSHNPEHTVCPHYRAPVVKKKEKERIDSYNFNQINFKGYLEFKVRKMQTVYKANVVIKWDFQFYRKQKDA